MQKLIERACSILKSRLANEQKVLAVLDENHSQYDIQQLTRIANIDVITNRYDIFKRCESIALHVKFSDFSFIQEKNIYDLCLYRVSKERAVSHHILNNIARIVKQNGLILLEGRKSEGIKSYHKNIVKQLSFSGGVKKNKDLYIAQLAPPSAEVSDKKLDDGDYSLLREVSVGNFSFYSKPGLYGWNKIDQGSSLLMNTALGSLSSEQNGSNVYQVLDLGCGFGYLSIRLLEAIVSEIIQCPKKLVATDNNAAAVIAARKNIQPYVDKINKLHWGSIQYEVVADDCGASLPVDFDVILCNPPFHQGFESSRELSDKFLHSVARLLRNNGKAYMVVNGFIPLQSLGKKYFKEITKIADDGRFKVFRLTESANTRSRCDA